MNQQDLLPKGESVMGYMQVSLSCVSYACLVYGMQEKTIESPLTAITYFHGVMHKVELPIGHFLVQKAIKGIGQNLLLEMSVTVN